MSTSLSPRPSGSAGHPTRKQLDELDALLQRMLALPVNQADEEVTAEINAKPRITSAQRQEAVSYLTTDYGQDAQETAATDEAQPKALPRLDAAHVAPSTETKEDADNWVPLSSTWKPSPHTWKPLAQSWQQPRPPAPAQETLPKHEEPVVAAPAPPVPVIQPPPAVAPIAPVTPEPLLPPTVMPAPVTEEAPLPAWLSPLVSFNVAFDVLLLPFGPPGRWLRRDGRGRIFLGVAGVLLLVGATAFSGLEWFGWTWDDLFARIFW